MDFYLSEVGEVTPLIFATKPFARRIKKFEKFLVPKRQIPGINYATFVGFGKMSGQEFSAETVADSAQLQQLKNVNFDKLGALVAELGLQDPNSETFCCIDSAMNDAFDTSGANSLVTSDKHTQMTANEFDDQWIAGNADLEELEQLSGENVLVTSESDTQTTANAFDETSFQQSDHQWLSVNADLEGHEQLSDRTEIYRLNYQVLLQEDRHQEAIPIQVNFCLRGLS